MMFFEQKNLGDDRNSPEGLEPDDEALETGECTGDPYTCQCLACRELWRDVKLDRAYDERHDAA